MAADRPTAAAAGGVEAVAAESLVHAQPPVVLAVDQGSSSTRCVAYDLQLRPIASGSAPVSTIRPEPGMVEHDPEELFAGVLSAIAAAREACALAPVAALGIADQTETFVVWDRATGEAATPVVSWQDQRAGSLCSDLTERPGAELVPTITGLGLDPTFSAPKLAWLFDRDPVLRRRAEAGDLLFGDVACWLAWKLSAGAGHISEPSNACRTLLVNLDTLDWDDWLLDLFGVPRALLPEIRASDNSGLRTDHWVTGFDAPIAAMLGDQPAALYGQGCIAAGSTALTLGTGAFVWQNAGPTRPDPPAGVLATVAWESSAEGRTYALEAFCANAGNALAVLRRVGLPPEAETAVPDWARARPVVVPAPFGLATPHWNPADRITVLGMSSATTPADLASAGLAGVAHQIVDALEALDIQGSGQTIRVGGGLAANEPLLQTVADLSGLTFAVAADLEATARGIAAMAAQSAGVPIGEPSQTVARTVTPMLAARTREHERERWTAAVLVHTAAEASA